MAGLLRLRGSAVVDAFHFLEVDHLYRPHAYDTHGSSALEQVGPSEDRLPNGEAATNMVRWLGKECQEKV